jgi:hypothetical protein
MIKKIKNNLTKLFSWLPVESTAYPEFMREVFPSKESKTGHGKDGLICIQCVPDRFFFLLFNTILEEIKCHGELEVDLISVRLINGAVGSDLLSFIKRFSILSWWWLSQWERAWGGNKNRVGYRCPSIFRPIFDLRAYFKSRRLWYKWRQNETNLSLLIDGIEVGDLIVDSYLRFRPSARFNPHDPFVKYIIWQALRNINEAKKYFDNRKPKFYLSSYTSYIEHGITARIALQYKIPVYTFGDIAQFGKKITPEDVYHTIDYTFFHNNFNELDKHQERMEEAETHLKKRLAGTIDLGTSYMKKSAYGAVDALLPQDFEDAVVVFLHDFYDNYNAYSGLIFRDFWEWVCFTIEVLQEAGIKFFIKPHPNQINLNDAVMSDLRKRFPKARWLPSNLSNVYMANAGMICGVTAYGTVAHELAYMGVPTIGYGKHPHHSFGFCRTARTKEEYAGMLRSPRVLPLSKVEMKSQALKFYYMRNLYGTKGQLELRKAFINLWRICNIEMGDDGQIIDSLRALRRQPEFKKFVTQLLA